MARINIADFDKVKGSIESVPPGTYDFIVQAPESSKSKAAGNDMLSFPLTIASGEHAGRNIRYRCVLVPQNAWQLKALVEAVGAPFDANGVDTDSLIGRKGKMKTALGKPDANGRQWPEVVEFINS